MDKDMTWTKDDEIKRRNEEIAYREKNKIPNER